MSPLNQECIDALYYHYSLLGQGIKFFMSGSGSHCLVPVLKVVKFLHQIIHVKPEQQQIRTWVICRSQQISACYCHHDLQEPPAFGINTEEFIFGIANLKAVQHLDWKLTVAT